MSVATIIAFIIRYRRILMYAAGAIAVLLALWWAVSGLIDHGRGLERAEWEERQRAAEAKAREDSWALVGNINAIDWKANEAKQATSKAEAKYVPVIQSEASVFYLANPNCRPPYRLWGTNDQLAREYAAAAGLSLGTLSGNQDAGQR